MLNRSLTPSITVTIGRRTVVLRVRHNGSGRTRLTRHLLLPADPALIPKNASSMTLSLDRSLRRDGFKGRERSQRG